MNPLLKRGEDFLKAEDLQFFFPILAEDLGKIMPGLHFELHTSDWEPLVKAAGRDARSRLAAGKTQLNPDTGKFLIPLVMGGAIIGLVEGSNSDGFRPGPEVIELMPHLVHLSLERLLFYKRHITDRETGFFNQEYFLDHLQGVIEGLAPKMDRDGRLVPLRLDERDSAKGLCLVLAEVVDFEKVCADLGRLDGLKVLKRLGGLLVDKMGADSCLSRLGPGRLGMVTDRTGVGDGLKRVGEISAILAEEYSGSAVAVKASFGITEFPHDLTEGSKRTDHDDSPAAHWAAKVLGRADQALYYALTDPDRHLFRFRDLLTSAGRVVQTLPYGRVVVNLGRRVGADSGRIFAVGDDFGLESVDFKGKVVLYDVREDFAIGEIVHTSAGSSIRAGDRLTPIGPETVRPDAVEGGDRSTRDPLLGIPGPGGFLSDLEQWVASLDRFGLVIAQVDGYERYRATMGHLESDRQVRSIYEFFRDRLARGGEDRPFQCGSFHHFLARRRRGQLGKNGSILAGRHVRRVSPCLFLRAGRLPVRAF